MPDEVSLIGVDDKLESALMTPPLTTIRQPSEEMGEASAEAILKLIQNKPSEAKSFTGQLQLRESVAMYR